MVAGETEMYDQVPRNTADKGVQTEENLTHTEREILNLKERVSKLQRRLQSHQDSALSDRPTRSEDASACDDTEHAAKKSCVDQSDDFFNLKRRLQRLERDVVALQRIQTCEEDRKNDRHTSLQGEISHSLESIKHDSESGCLRALFLLEQFENYNRLRTSWSDNMGRLFNRWQSRNYDEYKHLKGTSMMAMPSPARFSREILKDKETCIEWLMEQELLPRSKNCPRCKAEMKLDERSHGMGRFRCQRTHGSIGRIEQQVSKNTFFEDAKVSPMTAVLLIHAFTNNMNFQQAIKETSREEEQTSPMTVAQWYSYCRETCMDYLVRNCDKGKIGGEGRIVEIVECKICRRKYNRGTIINGHWIIAMIDQEGGFRLEICPNSKRNRETLEDLIKTHVMPGTTIVTDCWTAYTELDQHGFMHFTINNKYHLVDPESGANALMIASNWKPLRKKLARGVKEDQLAMHLCEFLWRKEMADQKMDPFISLLHEIKINYPVQKKQMKPKEE